MMELKIQLVPTGEIILSPGKNGESYCQNCSKALGSEGVRVMMESALTARDRVGVQDFVLLENHTSEAAFIENLRKRFKENLIYTYIGSVLVSVNPYKELEIYTKQHMERYRGVNFYEVSPHIYAVSDNAYRSMRTERRDQCILISGESGAGKTEASKKILQYYAVTCPASEQVQTVKDRLLQSNPVLEAFGNAKTLRNDNSSRFGKYMDIQFDFRGAPVGGHILNYLLEKSRVVHQNHGERNFHIFYQLIEGGEEDLLRRLGLERNTQQYQYLVKGNCPKVSSINDRNDWKAVRKALSVIGFNDDEVEELLNIIASVLHLGNVQFGAEESGNAYITTDTQIKYLARLLGVEGSILKEALTHKKIIAKGEELMSPLNSEQAASARDALSKAVYGRTFTWLVNKINLSLAYKDDLYPLSKNASVIGLLDIYGFEVFQQNSFEQFCINYCNEKLQQLFIELTLKSEQEEYESEGITWEPVQFFNNKIICDLVEEKFKGIISILDEECLRPGDASDLTFLEKLENTVGGHAHFVTHKLADGKTRKVMGREEFRLLHYAGEVNYNVNGFLDKNNDLLFRNLKEIMCQSENKILTQCFDREELTDKKRPETTATQFKNSLAKLMEILMSKEPSYIRCIKPNDAKQAGRFDEVLIRHQVKYLGLMENLRVRRAGFAYRRRYEVFLQRYKSLCPDTWPNWKGRLADGVSTLVKHLGYKPEEYKLGRSKIFIRFPKTLFATEDALEVRKHSLATKLQACWRGYSQKSKYLKMRHSAILIQAWWRGILALREAKRRRTAADTIRRFIKGFIYRKQPRCPENEYFLDYVRYSFLMNLWRNLPKTVLDKSWPTPPPALTEASEQLRNLCMQNMVWTYCKRISPERKHQLEQKLVASEIFKDKKDNYPQSVPKLFASTRLNGEEISPKVLQALGNEKMKYAVSVTKYDRKGYRARPRQLLLTASCAVIVEDSKLKQRIDYSALKGISVSSLSDGLFVLHVPCEDNKQKGDVVLQSDHVIETLTKVAICADKINNVNISQGSIKFTVGRGKEGVIDFTPGSELLVTKAKNGHLSVTAPRLNSR
ncbi:unconventional myosin-Ic-like isoform X1 [Scleropages formosus]|uniref:Unconventional myosin-Ic n=2 Tax=Scleropages formosus TaxID=113540 RepID=A0A8C9RXR5_SCLFO|nr:unconventional myosin-Ic isoform X1 [Scleropages formosus]XP_018606076.1 unconventional myosin-Ic isoform X1 [Scleropages formosus]